MNGINNNQMTIAMKTIFYKSYILGIMLLMFVGLMTSCGGDDDVPSPDNNSGQSKEPESDVVSVPTDVSGINGPSDGTKGGETYISE